MNKKFRRGLILILGVVFIYSVGMQIRQNRYYEEGRETYSKAEELAGIKKTEEGEVSKPAATETPTPESTETPTPKPTATATPEPTATPISEPTMTPTPEPTATPELTATPTPEPTATATPEPTATPTPEPTATPTPEPTPKTKHVHTDPPIEVDIEALQEINSDVKGWIYIPDTEISYPVMQGEDNDYYLNHTWEKEENSVGSIFFETRNHTTLNDFNTIIYGHRMKNNSMFGRLKFYVEQDFWEEHPKVYIMNKSGAHCYEIFAAYEAETDGGTYKLRFENDEEKQEYIDKCLEQSDIDTGVVPTVDDKILTLSTCVANGTPNRWIVQGVIRTEEGETNR